MHAFDGARDRISQDVPDFLLHAAAAMLSASLQARLDLFF